MFMMPILLHSSLIFNPYGRHPISLQGRPMNGRGVKEPSTLEVARILSNSCLFLVKANVMISKQFSDRQHCRKSHPPQTGGKHHGSNLRSPASPFSIFYFRFSPRAARSCWIGRVCAAGSFSPYAGCSTLRLVIAAWNPSQPEITDLIVQHDPQTLERVPVRKQQVLDMFHKFGNRQAIRAVEALPERDGSLDAQAIDRIFVTVHWEMQRLAEEFLHGHRVHELLASVVSALRAQGFQGPLRVVDVGCGIGYVIQIAARCSLLNTLPALPKCHPGASA